MANGIDIRIEDSVLRTGMSKMAGTFRDAIASRMSKVVLTLERAVKTGAVSGQLLKSRTGTLRRAVFSAVEHDATDVIGIVGADLKIAPQARAQELGALIKPRRARNLTIPIGAALTGNGVTRFRARDVISNPGSYGYVGTFTKDRILFGKREGGQVVPLFALRPSVTLKPVGYLSNTVREREAWIRNEISLAGKEALEKTLGG